MPIYEIKNPEVKFISLVKKGANNKKFFFVKSNDDGGFSVNYLIKGYDSDDERHVVKCVTYEPYSVDLQGDFMTEKTIEDYAYNFMKNYRNIDFQHNFQKGFGDLVESYIAPIDMVVNNEHIRKGSHVISVEINNDIFKMVKDGEITGVSIAGRCERVPVSKSYGDKNITLVKSIVDSFKEMFSKANDNDAKSNQDNKNEENYEELNMEEVKKMLNKLKGEILKEINEKNESIKNEFNEKLDSIKKKMDEEIGKKETNAEIKKANEKKATEKITELQKQIEELRKSIEDPQSSNSEMEEPRPESIFYKSV